MMLDLLKTPWLAWYRKTKFKKQSQTTKEPHGK